MPNIARQNTLDKLNKSMEADKATAVATVDTADKGMISRINQELAQCDAFKAKDKEYSAKVSAEAVKVWAKAGRVIEKEKQKLDDRNEKKQAKNKTNKQWNARNPDKKQRKIVEIPRWEGYFEDKKTSDLGGNSDAFSSSNNRISCSKKVSERLRKVAKYPKQAQVAITDAGKRDIQVACDGLSEATDAGEIEAAAKLGKSNVIATKFTGDQESYTPAEYIEKARAVMGCIDCDPASNDMAQETVRADEFYTVDDDGLAKDWSGNVWMNPPYSQPEIEQFIDKLCEHYAAGEVKSAVLLTNNSADTKWFYTAATAASAICFTKGRINFMKRDGTTSSPTNGQTFFYFGDDVDKFKAEFKEVGLIMEVI